MRLENADAIRWARHSLQIDDEKAESSTADLLRRVAEREYVVSPEAAAAVQMLANPEGLAAGSNIAALAEERGREQRLEKDVTDFANVFFDISPGRRNEHWQTLMNECRDIPALARWLSDLRPGLNVISMPSSADERFNELVKECHEIFVMRRLAGIRRRQEFVAMCREDRLTWELVARKLQSEHPLFVGNIAIWVNPLARLRSSDRDEHNQFQQLTRRFPSGFDGNSGEKGHAAKWPIRHYVERLIRARKTMSLYMMCYLMLIGLLTLLLYGLMSILKGGLWLIGETIPDEPGEKARDSTNESQR